MRRGLCLALVDALELLSAADWNIPIFHPKCKIRIKHSIEGTILGLRTPPFIFNSWLQWQQRLRFALMVSALLGKLLLPTSLDLRRGMGRTHLVAEAPFSVRLWKSTGPTLPSSFSSSSFGAQQVQIEKKSIVLDAFVD
jgi:hypothetical protein